MRRLILAPERYPSFASGPSGKLSPSPRLFCAVLLLLIGSNTLAGLPEPVRKALAKNSIPETAIGVEVRPLTPGATPLVSEHSDLAMNPASTIKVLTTFAALEILGPAYRWKTEVWTTRPVKDGVLTGDLVIKGYGDPFLTTERFWLLLFELRQRGLRDIRGNLLVDNSYFAPIPGDPGDFDGRPHRVYNALPEALVLNFQSTRFNLAVDESNKQVRVAIAPPLSNLKVDNRLRLVNGKCKSSHYRPVLQVEDAGTSSTVVLTGTFAESCPTGDVYRLAATGAKQIYGAFEVLWSELGGEFAGRLQATTVPDTARLFFEMPSPPLAEIIRSMNKFSNNLMTRQLLLTLGSRRYGPPATPAKGRAAVRDWLTESGLDLRSLVLDNGSGLSRKARISAGDMATLLDAIFASPYMPELVSSLPIAAIDGTMRRRLRELPVAGRAHIKTGSLNNVSAMAGYVLSQSGQRYSVVALINHKGVQSWQGKLVQDALLSWVYAQ